MKQGSRGWSPKGYLQKQTANITNPSCWWQDRYTHLNMITYLLHLWHRTLYKYDRIKHTLQNISTRPPSLCQDFPKYKITKNLARTLSLFLIFAKSFYKSKIRNIMTELYYGRWFTATNYDKVLTKQTKNQSTYSFAGQKLTGNSEYIAY